MELIYYLLFSGFIVFILGYLFNFYLKPFREKWNEYLEQREEENEKMLNEYTEMRTEIERLSAKINEWEGQKK